MMWVEYVVGAFVLLLGIAGLVAVIWALTRSKDRIQIVSLCLLVCGLEYGFVATKLYSQAQFFAVFVGLYALAVYALLAALAIARKPWALKAAVGVFVVHNLATTVAALFGIKLGSASVFASAIGMQLGGMSLFAAGLWSIAGAVGLWACQHKGSREYVSVPVGGTGPSESLARS